VCFGDYSSGDPTPRSYRDISIDKTVQAVLGFVNRFVPPNHRYQTMEQAAADHSLFASTLDQEERLISIAKDRKRKANETSGESDVQQLVDQALFEHAKATAEDFLARRAWVADAIMAFRRFGYDGLYDPNFDPEIPRHNTQYRSVGS
jgi:hypothetical protein